MENTTQLFLAVRFNCNKCHDHPVRALDPGPVLPDGRLLRPGRPEGRPGRAAGRMIGGTDVEAPKPLYEMVCDRADGRGRARPDQAGRGRPSSRSHAPTEAGRDGHAGAASWPPGSPRRTTPTSPGATSTGSGATCFGVGIIEPLDDIRAGNPPTNPELLDYLTDEFIKSGFNVRHVVRLICTSRTYQLSVDDEQVERRRQDQLLARDRPAAAGRGAARRGLPGDRLEVEVPGRRRRALAPRPCPTRASSCPAGS